MSAVFLDLDGTLMDSEPGILSSLRAAFTETGHADIAASDLKWMIGPPFIDSFNRIGVAEPHDVIEVYRRVYDLGGMFDAQVYDGVFQMLDALDTAGHRLYLATAKPHVAATKITAHFGIADYMVSEFDRNWTGRVTGRVIFWPTRLSKPVKIRHLPSWSGTVTTTSRPRPRST